MYRELLRQNRSRELVNDFLDHFIDRHGWWAARAAWVSDDGMVVDQWRISSHAPTSLDALHDQELPSRPIDPGPERFPDPVRLPVAAVRCTNGVLTTFQGERVDHLTVVDVPGILEFDLRLVFALPPSDNDSPNVVEALRTGTALLPTLLRQEIERDELRFGTMHDPMTGLLNRVGLAELSAQLTTDRDRRAVIFLDLDGFKSVNDSHGHAAGDAVLTDAAARLASAVRPTDLVARVGGDEFVVVAATLIDEQAAVALAQRLSASVSRDTILHSGAVVSVSASAGVTMWPESMSFDEAVDAADSLMFEAKRIGGGIATQDATGRVLVRDPLSGNAPPEEVDRGRDPVRVGAVTLASDGTPWGQHVILRGELCSLPVDRAVATVSAAVRGSLEQAELPRMIIEPRGRGWTRESVLLDMVVGLMAEHPTTEIIVMVDNSPASNDLRLVTDELRARLGVSVALAGIGSAVGGDVHTLVQVAPALVVLDRESTINLHRTQPVGIAATIAAAMAATVGAALLLIDPPEGATASMATAWGTALISSTGETPEWSSITTDERTS